MPGSAIVKSTDYFHEPSELTSTALTNTYILRARNHISRSGGDFYIFLFTYLHLRRITSFTASSAAAELGARYFRTHRLVKEAKERSSRAPSRSFRDETQKLSAVCFTAVGRSRQCEMDQSALRCEIESTFGATQGAPRGGHGLCPPSFNRQTYISLGPRRLAPPSQSRLSRSGKAGGAKGAGDDEPTRKREVEAKRIRFYCHISSRTRTSVAGRSLLPRDSVRQ
ncbi:unnamed protein product [Leptosia nina]|uniref:Uncharacterized protein n=1 Tax=Leptosia nina TaxID=320188 RepID=A0AAV1J0F7_9NEOP